MPSPTEPVPLPLVLTIDELRQALRCTQPARMIRWFRENGFTFKVGLDGYPVVSRAHWERVMGGTAVRSSRTEPNRAALIAPSSRRKNAATILKP
jgi:hypothetical protein